MALSPEPPLCNADAAQKTPKISPQVMLVCVFLRSRADKFALQTSTRYHRNSTTHGGAAQKRQVVPVWQRLQTEKSSPPKARLPL